MRGFPHSLLVWGRVSLNSISSPITPQNEPYVQPGQLSPLVPGSWHVGLGSETFVSDFTVPPSILLVEKPRGSRTGGEDDASDYQVHGDRGGALLFLVSGHGSCFHPVARSYPWHGTGNLGDRPGEKEERKVWCVEPHRVGGIDIPWRGATSTFRGDSLASSPIHVRETRTLPSSPAGRPLPGGGALETSRLGCLLCHLAALGMCTARRVPKDEGGKERGKEKRKPRGPASLLSPPPSPGWRGRQHACAVTAN